MDIHFCDFEGASEHPLSLILFGCYSTGKQCLICVHLEKWQPIFIPRHEIVVSLVVEQGKQTHWAKFAGKLTGSDHMVNMVRP